MSLMYFFFSRKQKTLLDMGNQPNCYVLINGTKFEYTECSYSRTPFSNFDDLVFLGSALESCISCE
jgi:hypothetical protein